MRTFCRLVVLSSCETETKIFAVGKQKRISVLEADEEVGCEAMGCFYSGCLFLFLLQYQYSVREINRRSEDVYVCSGFTQDFVGSISSPSSSLKRYPTPGIVRMKRG